MSFSFVRAPPTHACHYSVQQLKGYSSQELRDEVPALKSKLPTLGTRSYSCESVGSLQDRHLSQEAVRRYIEEQKNQ